MLRPCFSGKKISRKISVSIIQGTEKLFVLCSFVMASSFPPDSFLTPAGFPQHLSGSG